MSTSLHAGSLRRTLRSVVVAIVAAPLPTIAIASCGGTVATDPPDATVDASDATGRCRAREPHDASIPCNTATLVELVGDLDTCFADGIEKFEFCSRVCGTSSCDRVGNSVRCFRSCGVEGRGYVGLEERDAPTAASVGGYLARMAFYEAASVDAFTWLAHDLKALGAPAALVRACREASRDEVLHARMAAALAAENGAATSQPPTPVRPARDLEALATENAVEGCVRESFGVLIGMWQSRFAPAAELRAFFAAVTTDELRHAALSARIDAWACARLSPESKRRVEAARRRAVAELEASFATWSPVEGLGLPSKSQVRELFRGWQAQTSTSQRAQPRLSPPSLRV